MCFIQKGSKNVPLEKEHLGKFEIKSADLGELLCQHNWILCEFVNPFFSNFLASVIIMKKDTCAIPYPCLTRDLNGIYV